MAKPTLGYPTKTAAALALSAEGLNFREIGERMGLPLSYVRALVSGARRREADLANHGKLTLSRQAIAGLVVDAERRGITATRLATQLLEAICRERLVDAVLDDGHGDGDAQG